MPSLPAAIPASADSQTRRVTIARLGEMLATPAQRARWGVTVARVGVWQGVAPKPMTYEHGGLSWALSRGEALPVVERRPGGLCFEVARLVVRYHRHRVHSVTVTGRPGEFAVHLRDHALDMGVEYGTAETVLEVEGME